MGAMEDNQIPMQQSQTQSNDLTDMLGGLDLNDATSVAQPQYQSSTPAPPTDDDLFSGMPMPSNSTPGSEPEPQVHMFRQQRPETFAKANTIEINPEKMVVDPSITNPQEYKSLLPKMKSEGVLYSDDKIKISCATQQIHYL